MVQIFNSDKFSKALKVKRIIELDLTLRDASRKSRISFSTLSRMENGKPPELTSFIKACNWLDIPAGEFFSLKNKK